MESSRTNQWLTLAANVGVLIGLIVLIFELGQNTDMMRAQIVQSRAENSSAVLTASIHSEFWPQLAAKRTAADSDEAWISSLTPVEYERVRLEYVREVNNLQHLFYQYQEGYMPQSMWDGPVRRQYLRWLRLAIEFGQNCQRDEPFFVFVRELAQQENTATCGSNGKWQLL